MRTYSSGMFGRLAFSVAAHLKPEILLIDEALAAGDAAFKLKSMEKIVELCEHQDCTVLIVSHGLEVVQALAERCVWLDRGIVRYEGAADEVVVGLHGRGAHRGDERDRARRRVMREMAGRLAGRSYVVSKRIALARMRRPRTRRSWCSAWARPGARRSPARCRTRPATRVFQVFRLDARAARAGRGAVTAPAPGRRSRARCTSGSRSTSCAARRARPRRGR